MMLLNVFELLEHRQRNRRFLLRSQNILEMLEIDLELVNWESSFLKDVLILH